MAIWRNLEKNKEMLNYAAKSQQFIILDTETTGLKKEDEIIEFAGCKCRFTNGNFRVYDILHIFIKPSKPVPEDVTEINGITNEFLEDKPDERMAFQIIRNFMGDKPVIGAYNSAFDVRMLNAMYERNQETLNIDMEIDLLKIAKDIFCEQKMKDHKLITIANTYGVDEGIEFHTALDDVKVLIRVLNAMIKDIAEHGANTARRLVRVFKLNFYEGWKGNSRLYVSTSAGVIYYDLKNDKWKPNDERLDLSTVEMGDVERQVFQLAGCTDYKGLCKKCREGAFTSRMGQKREGA